MRPGIREDGAGRGLLRGAPTRPLARPHAQAPLKLPEAWRAEPPQSPALLSAQLRAAERCLAHSPRAALSRLKTKSLRMEAFVLLAGDTRRCIAFYDNI
ncbi:MAG: hypothetical protein K0S95_2686 [Pantoea eucrina]|jgi:hypothetical protein|nr:hypothetical protein [Pantoea eucrina]